MAVGSSPVVSGDPETGRRYRRHGDDLVRPADGAPATARAADWSAFWYGSVVGVVPWALIAVYVSQPARVPGFVYAITIVQFVLFFSFAVNMALQYAQVGRWRDHIHGEVVDIVLSFTAKSLLAWLIFANVLRA